MQGILDRSRCRQTGLRATSVGRYYDPNTAQFLSVDPLVNITGSPYSFAGDNPLDGTDPTGLMIAPQCDPTGCFSGSGKFIEANTSSVADGGSAASGAALGGVGGSTSGAKEGGQAFVDQAAEQIASKTAKQPLEQLSKGIVTFGRGFELFGVALSLTVDVNDHSSVGYILGDVGGGFAGGTFGAAWGAARCLKTVVGAVPCAIAGGILFGGATAYAGGYLGDAAEREIKHVWHEVFG